MTPCLSQPIIGTSVEVPVIGYQVWINTHNSLRIDGWMICDLTSFLTIFQSYQDGVWMTMKGCVQGNSVYG